MKHRSHVPVVDSKARIKLESLTSYTRFVIVDFKSARNAVLRFQKRESWISFEDYQDFLFPDLYFRPSMSNTSSSYIISSGVGGLKYFVAQRIINDMLRCDTVKRKEKTDWKVLVMDRLGTQIVSASCRMHDVMAEGVTIVEDVNKNREPLPQLEAIYFVTPTEQSVNQVVYDFDSQSNGIEDAKYRAAHIFFTEACNDELFNRLSRSKLANYTKTLRELNVAFIPYEKQVFTLGSMDTLDIVYNPANNQLRSAHLEVLAEQIATLCATLQEYPYVRFRAEFVRNTEFAHLLQSKMDKYKADDPSMGEGPDKSKSVLLILDRGFDAVTPLIHDLNFQAMAYDLVPIENDVYRYVSLGAAQESSSAAFEGSELSISGGGGGSSISSSVTKPLLPTPTAGFDGREKEVLLNDSDELWLELRHQHIATVSQLVTRKLKEFAIQKRLKDGEKSTIRDLSQMVKKLPQYQKEIGAYSLHLHLAEDCMKRYQGKLDKICLVEQNLVMGTDHEGEKIKDHMKYIVPILLDPSVSIEDKLRVIMLYIIHKNGITEENLDKLLAHASIPNDKRQIIMNLQLLNLQIIQDSAGWSARKRNVPTPRKERSEPTYHTSRWIPYVKDLMENVIDDKLDVRSFPFLGQKSSMSFTSVRDYGWHRQGRSGQGISGQYRSTGPRLIVFILGGLTYPEMRCAYEVTSASKKWEVIIGSDHIITPKQFLSDLEMKSGGDGMSGAQHGYRSPDEVRHSTGVSGTGGGQSPLNSRFTAT